MFRYAAAEFAVTELLVRAAGREEYASFKPLPFAWPRRLKLLSRLLQADGPIRQYASSLRAALGDLSEAEQYRHIFAHGFMDHNGVVDSRDVRFRAFHHKNGELGGITWTLSVDQMNRLADEMRPVVERVLASVDQIIREVGLLPIGQAEAVPLDIDRRQI